MKHKRYINPDTIIHVTARRLLEVQISSEDLTEEENLAVIDCLETIPSFRHENDNEGIFALFPGGLSSKEGEDIFDTIYGDCPEIPKVIKDALRACQDINDEDKPEDPGYCLIVLS